MPQQDNNQEWGLVGTWGYGRPPSQQVGPAHVGSSNAHQQQQPYTTLVASAGLRWGSALETSSPASAYSPGTTRRKILKGLQILEQLMESKVRKILLRYCCFPLIFAQGWFSLGNCGLQGPQTPPPKYLRPPSLLCPSSYYTTQAFFSSQLGCALVSWLVQSLPFLTHRTHLHQVTPLTNVVQTTRFLPANLGPAYLSSLTL